MANVLSNLGYKAVQRLDGALYVGNVTSYRIPSGYATTIGQGDPVKFVTGGQVQRSVGTDQFRGILMGVAYQDVNNRPVRSNFWLTGTVTFNAQDAMAYIIDDPNLIFEAQMGTSTTQTPPVLDGDFGKSYNSVMGTVSTLSGLSGAQLDYSTRATTLQQWRLLRYVERVDNDTAAYGAKAHVVPLNHDFRINLGV